MTKITTPTIAMVSVLAVEVGARAELDRARDLLHTRGTGVWLQGPCGR